ncbi:glutamyl-tRNA(Gln) amidotransferase subunit A [Nannizzia gypsea CBS 118893]|uniref:Glutamyl-tRNA(Gln) amidotransferase subunit A n=1 Tax=Arthroderma gypseum (strain ATCC MYA-4604 / CBS 118893) TaxID=535722 RepID=E4UXP9_ARTGP|nr:glutamyl-tRNA(Gln) amidotransferase subunit A [Nannizzia gypsea CBS 118893]EFR01944.1 glutamyl-tRNA(Gln) amidotransferase subunit A [Nannizzia gypsea CBS 118893]
MQILQDSLLPAWAAFQSLSDIFSFRSPETPRFNPAEATIQSVHQALYANISNPETRLTCREVVTEFLNQIEKYNPRINAIISLDADSLSIADELDARLHRVLESNPNNTFENSSWSNDIPLPSLFCIPVLLKDNFDTANHPTTAGCAALSNSAPALHDAPVVKALCDAGAVILGKTNMHEMALEGLTVSSLGGQTLNPYDYTRTPGGSSGGTGAAIASSFAVLGLGTDTVNSLRSPASANSLFSMRPTRGLISRAGVLPVSYTQDTVGPIARCVWDLAVSLNVMAMAKADGWFDTRDNLTALRPRHVRGLDYTNILSRYQGGHDGGLKGVRLGLVEGFINRTDSPETTPVCKVVDAMVSRLEKAGATVVRVADSIYNSSVILGLDVQAYEYREMVDSYLQAQGLRDGKPRGPRTMAELYSKIDNEQDPFLVIPHQYAFIQSALVSSPLNISYAQKRLSINALTLSVKRTFSSHSLDALIYPQQQNLPVKIGSRNQHGRNGILAALTGSPVITVPAGFSNRDIFRGIPVGVPIGMEIMGLPWEEERLLSIAARIEALENFRRPPVLKEDRARRSGYRETMDIVPTIVPNRLNIHDMYPLGMYRVN